MERREVGLARAVRDAALRGVDAVTALSDAVTASTRPLSCCETPCSSLTPSRRRVDAVEATPLVLGFKLGAVEAKRRLS